KEKTGKLVFPQTAPLIVPDQNSDRVRRKLAPTAMEWEGVVYLQTLRRSTPRRWAKALDEVNGHQVAVGKRLESHDE
ncbi:hypothetical protein A2U01_0067392, partial [Trifolium medium]|nr:hypothetical protein [Trifolium medium]